jgi:hypothetical protein
VFVRVGWIGTKDALSSSSLVAHGEGLASTSPARSTVLETKHVQPSNPRLPRFSHDD